MPSLAADLLTWFRSRQRPLPWRTRFPRDPYAVLVSEVMAQQTQIERAAQAYRRFLERFPTLRDLAAGSEGDVLQAFSGLGYYRRARLLHQAAKAIVARGRWPETPEQLRELPGFGAYTSAAVSAFSFGGGDAPVDGNLARVTARVRRLGLAMGSAALLTAGADFARSLFAETPNPEVWEALMELGATVCAPAAPRCGLCPFSGVCLACAAGDPEAYPLPRRQRKPEAHRWTALWVERPDGRVLLRRVEDSEVLNGMWLPPFRALAAHEEAGGVARTLARSAGYSQDPRAARPARHSITHRRIVVFPFVVHVRGFEVFERGAEWSWQDWRAPTVATSSLLGKLGVICGAAGPGAATGNGRPSTDV